MDKLHFELTLSPSVGRVDREKHNIVVMDCRALRRLAYGKIIIHIGNSREPIEIESEVLDYLMQLRTVIDIIDSGTHTTCAVSGDYYSNNIWFSYDIHSHELEIREGNGGLFRVKVPYSEFCESFLAFYKRAMLDLRSLYPELQTNKAFEALLRAK